MGSTSSKLQDQHDICFIGVDNAGKSTIIRQLLKHISLTTTSPTNGYESQIYYHPVSSGCKQTLVKFSLVDLGGHEKIRGIWKNYFATSQALVFVFDASDSNRYTTVCQVLQQILEDPNVQRLPKLFLANKQDLLCKVRNQQDFQEHFHYQLGPDSMFQPCVGIVYDDKGISEGHSWLFEKALQPQIVQHAQEQKVELKQRRVGAGMTTEEKLRKLEEIRKRNDEIDAQEKLRKQDKVSDDQALPINNSNVETEVKNVQDDLQQPPLILIDSLKDEEECIDQQEEPSNGVKEGETKSKRKVKKPGQK